jgi:hypothetical protein
MTKITKREAAAAEAFDRFVADCDRFALPAFERGVTFVAFNDDNASTDALDLDAVAGLISVITLSEAFGLPSDAIAYAVVAKRHEEIDRADAARASRVPARGPGRERLVLCDGCGTLNRRDSFGADADGLCRCPACVAKSAKRAARRSAKGGR